MRRLGLVAIAAVVTLSACGSGSAEAPATAAPTAGGLGAAKLIAVVGRHGRGREDGRA